MTGQGLENLSFNGITFFYIALGLPTRHYFRTSLILRKVQWSMEHGISYPFYRWEKEAKRLVITYREKG